MIFYLNDFFLAGTINKNPPNESHFCFRSAKRGMGVRHHDNAYLAFSDNIGRTSWIVNSILSKDLSGKTFATSLNCGLVSSFSSSNQGRYLPVTSSFALILGDEHFVTGFSAFAPDMKQKGSAFFRDRGSGCARHRHTFFSVSCNK